jgi:metal-sulfur cluster biosynthetic enzyme
MSDKTLPTPDEVRAEIKAHVRDPELMMNIVDLGLIYDIEVTNENHAEITMTLTSPGCPAGPQIITDVQRTTHNAFPNLDEVNVHLVWTPFWNPDMMSDDAKDELGIF